MQRHADASICGEEREKEMTRSAPQNVEKFSEIEVGENWIAATIESGEKRLEAGEKRIGAQQRRKKCQTSFNHEFFT